MDQSQYINGSNVKRRKDSVFDESFLSVKKARVIGNYKSSSSFDDSFHSVINQLMVV